MTRVVGNIIYQIVDAVYLITTYVHDDIEGSKGNHIHELGMDLCRIKATLQKKSYPCLILVTREILVRSEGKNMAKEAYLPPLMLHFIYPLLKI